MEERELPDDLEKETDRFWQDPRKVMMLIDLLFLWDDDDKERICS